MRRDTTANVRPACIVNVREEESVEIQGTRFAPQVRFALAAAIVALLALLLAQAWRPVLISPDGPGAPLMNAPATADPVGTAPVPLTSAPPAELMAVPTVAPVQAPSSIAPSSTVPSSVAPGAPPIRSAPPQADPNGPGAMNIVAPVDDDPSSVPPKQSLPPKG